MKKNALIGKGEDAKKKLSKENKNDESKYPVGISLTRYRIKSKVKELSRQID